MINVAGQNLLMLHGHGFFKGKLDTSINDIIKDDINITKFIDRRFYGTYLISNFINIKI